MLKWYDGFTNYHVQADIQSQQGTFCQYNATVIEIQRPGRNGVGAWLNSIGLFGASVSFTFADRNATAIVGFAFKAGTSGFWQFRDTVANTVQFSMKFDSSNGRFTVYHGDETGTVLYLGPNNAFNGSVDNFIEFKPTISHTGSLYVQLNSIPLFSITGVNLQSSTNAWFDQISIYGGLSAPTNTSTTDLYYCDTIAGPGTFPCNDFLGDSRTATLYPIGNSAVQWSPLANTNWQEVNETAFDADATYNHSSTPGQQDLLNFQALENTVTVMYGVMLKGAYRKDDAGLRQVKQALLTGGSTFYGTTFNLPDTFYSYFADLFPINPKTGLSWTLSDVNALAAGYQLVA